MKRVLICGVLMMLANWLRAQNDTLANSKPDSLINVDTAAMYSSPDKFTHF